MYMVAPVLLFLFFCLLLLMHHGGPSREAFGDILSRLAKEGAPFALMAIGESLVIASGSIDLSMVGTVAVSGASFAALTQLGLHPLLAALACIGWGGAVGYLLGSIITKTQCPALIMSWSLGVIGLLAAVIFGGAGLVRGTAASIPLGFFTEANFWYIRSFGFLSSVTAVIVSVVILNWSSFPTFCCAVGANKKAAVYAGIDSSKVLRAAFTINGFLCSLAGIYWALMTNAAAGADHVGKELVVIAISVLGGTALSGGYLLLSSVAASAFFWAAAKMLVDSLDLGLVGNLQSQAATGIFALVLMAVILTFNRRLAHSEGMINYQQRYE